MLIAIKFSELVKNKYDPVAKGRCLCGKCVNSEFSTKKGGYNNQNLVFHLFLKHIGKQCMSIQYRRLFAPAKTGIK
jgi:hypothetical protein